MIMRLFQKYGHTPIILIGTGTTRIGDPSGKDETRKILTDDEIQNNANNLKTVFDKYLSFKNEENKALVMDNADWLDKLSLVDFLRDFGKHFTINKMLTFDSVKISDEQLFYCMQRGLDAEEAQSLIVNGFCKEVLQKLPMEFAVEAQKLVSISLEGSVG